MSLGWKNLQQGWREKTQKETSVGVKLGTLKWERAVCARAHSHRLVGSTTSSRALFIVTKWTAPRLLIQQLISHLIYYVNEMGKQFPVSHRYPWHERYWMNSLESHVVTSIRAGLVLSRGRDWCSQGCSQKEKWVKKLLSRCLQVNTTLENGWGTDRYLCWWYSIVDIPWGPNDWPGGSCESEALHDPPPSWLCNGERIPIRTEASQQPALLPSTHSMSPTSLHSASQGSINDKPSPGEVIPCSGITKSLGKSQVFVSICFHSY